MHPLSIVVLIEERYLAQAQPAGMCAALRARSHHVILIDPETTLFELGDGEWPGNPDLIVARGRSWTMLCWLAWAEARGIQTINHRAAIAGVHNKAEMAVALATASVPTPRTFLGPVDLIAVQIARANYPIILKPIFGDNCRGLRLVHNAAELAGLEWLEPTTLAQHYLPGDGYDLKLYGIGDEIWVVRKPSPLDPQTPNKSAVREREVELLPLTPALRDLGRRCGALFGLELYGVDCVQTADGLAVIEVNDFPNYSGVPGADDRLADYVVRRARQERRA